MKITRDFTRAIPPMYVPIALGNGDLSLQIDGTGAMEQREYCGMTPDILRAGVRYDHPPFPLISLGHFTQELPGNPALAGFVQELDPKNGICQVESHYQDGSVVHSTLCCHRELNLLIVRKELLHGAGGLTLRYEVPPSRLTVSPKDGGLLHYFTPSVFQPVEGTISFHFQDMPELTATQLPRGWRFHAGQGALTLLIAFDQEARTAVENGTSAQEFIAASVASWKEFYRESRVPVYAGRLGEAARMAEYHLAISSTRHSIPVGLYHNHWEGRYFGFDEYFALRGVLAAGHHQAARRVVEFRHRHLLAARSRNYQYFGETGEAARFVWEAIEEPGIEGSPSGFWLDHIFHIAHIALSARDYCCFTNDRDFLRQKGYPLMRAAAQFFLHNAIIHSPAGRIIGPCTDLERLGAARTNPFMTTCSAIATLEAAANAAAQLQEDASVAEQWRQAAEELRRTLPGTDQRYLPYPGAEPGCSIALLSGLYPYNVLPADDPRQLQAIQDYLQEETRFGNMYPLGNKVCAWYAGWKCLTLLELGRFEAAAAILQDMAENTGCFSETFEILENGSHPYFVTAEGIFLEALVKCHALCHLH